METLNSVAVIVIGVAIFTVPYFVARRREHAQLMPITVLAVAALVAGMVTGSLAVSAVIWLVALVWALMAQQKENG